MKIFSRNLICCIFLFCSLELYADKVTWPVMLDNKGQVSLLAQMWVDQNKQQLYPLGASIKFTEEKKYLGVLSKYYAQVIAGDISKLSLMFTNIDSSQNIFRKSLQRHPDKYSGYKEVETVNGIASTKWGPYDIATVKLDGAGKSMYWREAVLCENTQCQMSNFLNTIDEPQQVFTAIQKSFYKKMTGSLANKALIQQSGLNKKENAIVFLPLNTLRKELKQVPIVFFPKVNKKERIVTLSSDIAVNDFPEALYIIKFVNKLRNLEVDKEAGKKLNEYPELDEFMRKNWLAYKKGLTFPVFVPREKQGKNNALPKLEKQSYLAFPFYEYIKKWEAINFIGSINGQDRDYVLFRPIIGKLKQPLQIICVAKDSKNTLNLSMSKTHDSLSKMIINSYLASFLDSKTNKP